MRHEVEHAVPLQHPLPGCDRDVMASLDADGGIHFEVRVHHDHVAHLAGAHVVHVANAFGFGFGEHATDRLDLPLVDRVVHQVMQRIPAEAPSHLGHHEADDERRDRVEDRVAGQVADDADADHQRRSRIGTRVPGVGDQHARLHALGDGQHVAKEQFLGDERAAGNPERRDMHLLHGLRRLELSKRGPQHAHAHGEKQHAQGQRRPGLESLMAVGMVLARSTTKSATRSDSE